jgi:hypothetical protein
MPDIRHFDNASLPGSFVLAIHHYVKTLYPTSTYEWAASSYIGAGDHLCDDYKLFENYPEHWTMSETNNGDITDVRNIDDIIATSQKFNLFTSDLGFDASGDYNNQERLHMVANVGQMLLCINLLEDGGNCVIKHYTTFELFTLSYLMVFAQLFDECYIYKPLSSKRTNSEVYVVGKGFCGAQKGYLDAALRGVFTTKIFRPVATAAAVERFITDILPSLELLTKRQIQALSCQNAILARLISKFEDLAFCRRYIYKMLPYKEDVGDYYKMCLFERIGRNDVLNVKNLYIRANVKN